MIELKSKEEEKRKHIRGSALLLFGRLIAIVLNLSVQVLVVRYLAKSDYGAFAFAISVVALATNISLLGLNKSLARFMAIYHESNDFPRMAGTAVLIISTVVGTGIALILGVIGCQSIIGNHLVSEQLSLTLLLMLIVLVPIDSLDSVFQSIFGVFGDVRAVFVRRHLLGPLLKLLAIIGVMLFQGSVLTLAVCYVAAGVAGIGLYIILLIQVIKKEKLAKWFQLKELRFPVREVFGFSLPLLSSQLGFVTRGALVVVFLEALQDSIAVANFRSILPFARLNLIVITSFAFLFTPTASRMYSRREAGSMNSLYWTNAVWVLVLTFPALLLTCVFAQPLTVALLGQRYHGSGIILALMSIGFFFDAILGFTVQTLRVEAKVRSIVITDIFTLVLAMALYLVLIPLYGAIGAACGAMMVMVFQNCAYFLCMRLTTSYGVLRWKHAIAYVEAVTIALLLFGVQYFLEPHLAIDVVLVGLAAMLLLVLNRQTLQIGQMFPELARLPLIGRFLSAGIEKPDVSPRAI